MEIDVNLDEFTAEVNDLSRRFAEAIPKILQGAALSSFAIIRNRIQERGMGPDGEYPGYSTNELPTFFFLKDKDSKVQALIKKAEKEERGISYKEYKGVRYGEEAASKRTLTATGDMWRNAGITSTEQTETGMIVTVSGETDFAKKKMGWNAEQIGDFMELSKGETQDQTENFQAEIDRFFQQNQ